MKKPLLLLLLVLTSCRTTQEKLEPQLNYSVQERYLKRLPGPFPPLTEFEKMQDWGREYLIGQTFARQVDLYQAMTAFKRALILVPRDAKERKLEMEYQIILCYYLGKKYSEATQAYEKSELRFIDQSFPATQDLLILLHDSYSKTNEELKAQRTLEQMKQLFPEAEKKVEISDAVTQADFPKLEEMQEEAPYLKDFLTRYESEKKSIGKARVLNMVLPGAGYLYLGQKQSALTAFLLNGLFITAAYYSFDHGNVAAGIILTSFEAGWYFGGIYGAGEEAKFYNERLYERYATPMMNQQGLFPVLMLKYAF